MFITCLFQNIYVKLFLYIITTIKLGLVTATLGVLHKHLYIIIYYAMMLS